MKQASLQWFSLIFPSLFGILSKPGFCNLVTLDIWELYNPLIWGVAPCIVGHLEISLVSTH